MINVKVSTFVKFTCFILLKYAQNLLNFCLIDNILIFLTFIPLGYSDYYFIHLFIQNFILWKQLHCDN